MRLPCVAALTLTFGLLACADAKKESAAAQGDRAAKFAELKKKFADEEAGLKKKLKDATDNNERRNISTEARELFAITAGKAIDIAEENPKDDTALDAAAFALEKLAMFGIVNRDFDKAAKVITENHLGNPKAKDVVVSIAQAGPAGQALLKTVAEKATDKGAKAAALYFLGAGLVEQALEEDDEKRSDAIAAEAADYLEKAVKEGGEVRLGTDLIAKLAPDQLATLKSLRVGGQAPNLESVDLDGKKVKLGEFKGKVVLLDIWATWCGPCKAMIPHNRELVKRFTGKPFALISVSADAKKETVAEFIAKEPMPWVHWFDGQGGDVAKTLRIQAFPTLYLIDAKGVIRKKWVGAPKSEVLDKAVEELVKEALGNKG